MTVPTLTFARESTELVTLTVTVAGAPTVDYSVCVVPYGTRPAVFVAPTVAGSDSGYLTGSLPPGLYDLWVRVVDNPEIPTRADVRLMIE